MAQRDPNSAGSSSVIESDAKTRIPANTDHEDRSCPSHKTDAPEKKAVSINMAMPVAEAHSLPPSPQIRKPISPGNTPTRIIETDTSNVQHSNNRQGNVVDVGSILKERFVLERVIARGGMGVVYKARDLRKEEYKDREPYVAVKVLGEQCKNHPDFFMALQRETRKAQKLAHPNIVTVYDFDSDGDTVFMTMEYLEGQTVDEFIRDNQPYKLKLKTAFSIINDMGQGLAYAHKKDIVHCDFKPGNVFLTRDGTVKILDFGISRAAKHSDKRSPDTTLFDAGKLGAITPPYASCEMIEGDEPDPRDDIYALACVAYELLTGNHPFDKEKATVARNKRMKPDRIKGLNKHQWKGLLSGLTFKRAIRTPSVDQFLLDIAGSRFMGLTRSWEMVAGLAFLTLLAGAFLSSYLVSIGTHDTNDTSRVVVPSEPVYLSLEQRDKISRLMEAAEAHFDFGHITEPPGSNAYDAYKHILEINPQDQQARAGLVKIADHYEKMAEESWKNGDIEKSLETIAAGMNILPNHSGLSDLKQKVEPDTSWFKRTMKSFADLF